MNLLRLANLAIAFGLELCMLAALAVWGAALDVARPWDIVAAVAAVAAAVTAWGVLAAPKSTRRLAQPWLTGFKLAMFGIGSLALVHAGHPGWAALLIAAAAINLGLALAWKQSGVA